MGVNTLPTLGSMDGNGVQGASLMAKFGVNVPRGQVASTPAEAGEAARELAPLSADNQVHGLIVRVEAFQVPRCLALGPSPLDLLSVENKWICRQLGS